MYLNTADQFCLPAAAPARPVYRDGIVSLRALNATIERVWRAGLQRRPVLEPRPLIERAMRKGRLADFGPGPWRPLLDCLLAALDGAALSPLGEVVAENQLTAALAARLRVRAILAAHPEIADIAITAPIIIIGQMRSGTTRLQRLLAVDPRLDHTRLFESWLPVAAQRPPPAIQRPPVAAQRPPPAIQRPPPAALRRARVAGWLAATRAINPGFGAIHPTWAGAADEEIGLLGVTLCSSQFEVQWRVPAYARLCETIDRAPVYAEFRTLLQITRWLRGGDHAAADRPWVLKVPQFTQDLAALLAVFPDARLLRLDRDAATTLASSVSLVHNQMAMQSAAADPRWIGEEWLRKLLFRHHTMRGVLAAPGARHLGIDYAAMDRDWQAEMHRIYAFLGLELPAAVTGRMARLVDRSGKRKRHDYDLAGFGLCPENVRRQLAPVSSATARPVAMMLHQKG